MENGDLQAGVVFQFGLIEVTNTVITSWIIMIVIGVISWGLTRRLSLRPGKIQTAIEGIVETIETAIFEVAPHQTRLLLPFIATLWVYLIIANLSGLIPGVHSPTRDLSATSALALLVFLSVHWFGIRTQGIKVYLRHYLVPSPIL